MLITLAVLLAAGLVAIPLSKRLGRRAGWPLAGAYVIATATFAPTAWAVGQGGLPTITQPWIPSLGASFTFRADGLSVVFTLMALVVGAVVFCYSARYLGEGRHLSFFLVMVGFTWAMLGLVLADNLLLFFLCWELTSLASFMLIARSGRPGEQASMRTLLLTFTGGLSLLTAVVLIADRTGTTTLSVALDNPIWQDNGFFTSLVAVLVAIGGFSKAAQFPFHIWLPDAMAAPTPVSAYLHAAAVVKAGIFLLLRFSPAFHDTAVWNAMLIIAGLFTSLIGARFALEQTDLKRLMAYSTVSQLGLITATIGIGTETAILAAILHTIAHALFKSGLFMMVGVVDHAAHTRDIRRLPPHLWRAMPVTAALTALGAASMAGLPPLLGFVSKESLFTGLLEAPGPAWAGPLALFVGALASIMTFAYCAKIVLGAFVDGRDSRDVQRPESALVVIAAITIVAGLPLGLAAGLLDPLITRAGRAALPHMTEEAHFTLWHGFTPELFTTLGVFAAGIAFAVTRRRWYPVLERRTLPFDGPQVIAWTRAGLRRVGHQTMRPTGTERPARHLALILVSLIGVLGVGSALTALLHPVPASRIGWGRPADLLVLILVCACVWTICRARSRLAATVALSAVGILAVLQIQALGAPDVMLTQLLVESLTVIVIMLVLQRLPRTFASVSARHRRRALVIGSLTGASAGLGTWLLSGRRDRSALGTYYLEHAYEITGGHNVVNVILVEFRALDTFGEVAVLGMTGVALIAVISSVRNRFIDPGPDVDHREPPPEPAFRDAIARRALTDPNANAVPVQVMVRITFPILSVLSLVLFLRGHNDPGGGFISALVGSAIVALLYLSTPRDRTIGPPRLPVFLIGGGLLFSIAVGIWALIAKGSFLTALHADWFGVHVTTSVLFDVGVYAAVLGLILITFNLLGSSEDSGVTPGTDATRERADETIEGKLAGPLDTVRGDDDRPVPVAGLRTTLLADARVHDRESEDES